MSGKSYTLSEMKTIVDYLVEHKAYGDTKGRKMWINFANSPLTNRTWQSLKETFLKRILPDICNPYYNLSPKQIHSFKQGTNVEDKEQNKLEIHVLSDESNSNVTNSKKGKEHASSKDNAEKSDSGEEIRSKILSRDRSSVDTVILDRCYETADEVRKVLESPSDNNEISNSKQDLQNTQESLGVFKTMITFSEPLTPLLQEVLHDFTSDDSNDSEQQMQIVENKSILDAKSSKQLQQSSDSNTNPTPKQTLEKTENEPKIKSLRFKKKKANNETNENLGLEDSTTDNVLNFTEKESPLIINSTTKTSDTSNSVNKKKKGKVKSSEEPTPNCSNNTADTVLPNNQEALDSVPPQHSKSIMHSNNVSEDNKQEEKKRSVSQAPLSTATTTVAKNSQKHVSMSDSDIQKTKKPTGFQKSLSIKKKVSSNKINKADKNNQSTENKKEISNNDEHIDCSIPTSQINPCLQSVSLFDEHFDLHNYNKTSDTDEKQMHKGNENKNETEQNKTIDQIDNEVLNKNNNTSDVGKTLLNHEENNLENINDNVVLLDSHSDSGSDKLLHQSSVNEVELKVKRNNALNNLFGFSSGAVIPKRKRGTGRKVSNHRSNRSISSLDSSEWTSELDSEYELLPRSRKRRRGDFIKPRSLRIQSSDDGTLFVIFKNKIYPLEKTDGQKMKKCHLNYTDSDSETDKNYWKEMYEKEKKRVEELKRLVSDYAREKSPLLPYRIERNLSAPCPTDTQRVPTPKQICGNQPEPPVVAEQKEANVTSSDKKLKITFAKHDQKVKLQGLWSQLHPVLAEVVDIFHKDPVPDQAPMKPTNKLPSVIMKPSEQTTRSNQNYDQDPLILNSDSEKSSTTTSVDLDIRERTLQMENEIFKTIADIDRTPEKEELEDDNAVVNNVTKRKRQIQVDATTSNENIATPHFRSPSYHRSPKRTKTTLETKIIEETNKHDTATSGLIKGVNKTVTPKKKLRTPKKKLELKDTTTNPKNDVTVKKAKKSLSNVIEPTVETDNETLYMFPLTKNSYNNTRNRANRKHLIANHPKILSSPSISQNSESNQGYVDSDVSPVKVLPKRRRRLSLFTDTKKYKAYRRVKRHSSYPKIFGDISNDSDTLRIVIKQHNNDGSLQSSIYRSESFQLLLPRKKKSFNALDKITEEYLGNQERNRQSHIFENCETITGTSNNKIHNDIASYGLSSCGNSSSASLPPSPELSIVEKMSVSTELIDSVNRYQNINYANEHIMDDQHLTSKFDVSMPLMQHSGIKQSQNKRLEEPQYNITMIESKKSSINESLLNKIETVNILGGTSLSDSLNHRLQHLFLESAKKMSKSIEKENDNINAGVQKAKNSKRCSTPHKKKLTKKEKPLKIESVVEEEQMETCSYGGRKSCPPSIETINYDNIAHINQLTALENEKGYITKENGRITRGRVKKDIIKVKILKPKVKGKNKVKEPKEIKTPCDSQSARADSGINVTESAFLNNSADLMHTHSETCLHANHCLDNNFEYIESTKSMMPLNSKSIDLETPVIYEESSYNGKDIITDILSNNTKDLMNVLYDMEPGVLETEYPTETQYHSPIASECSINSLITEDMSDDMQTSFQSLPSSSWYLVSDDDNSNTNMAHVPKSNSSSFGANLQQIFPITYAVPNLSTITEMSKEENSRKPFSDISACDTNTNDVETN